MKKNSVKIPVLMVIIAILLLVIGYIGYRYINPISVKQDNVTVGLNDRYDPADDLESVFLGSKSDVVIKGTIDTSKRGDYKIDYDFKGKHKVVTVSVRDITPPTVELQEVKTDLVSEVKADDFIKHISDETKTTADFEKTPSKNEGMQRVIIVVKDEDGNVTKSEGTLIRERDGEAPKVDISDSISLPLHEAFDSSIISVSDNIDKKPEVIVEGDDNPEKEGNYSVKIVARDASGNETTKTIAIRRYKVSDVDYPRVAYFTFDDGPSENTAKVLDILKAENVKATFFVTGCNKRANGYIKRAYSEGHSIGLHTMTHQYQIYSSEASFFKDLSDVDDMVYNLIGIRSKITRFPGGSSNTVSKKYARGIMSVLTKRVESRGYRYFDWNVSSGDAAAITPPEDNIYKNAVGGIGQKRAMVLFHDSSIKGTTVKALPKIIKAYKKAGYVFLPITESTPAVHHPINN